MVTDSSYNAAQLVDKILRAERLHCFIRFDPTRALQRARSADECARPDPAPRLQGMALAVKDNIDLEGEVTTAGCPALTRVATQTAPVLLRLLQAGAYVIGKSNLHELAFGVTSQNAAFGTVHNPLNEAWSAGGSSGGSAAAVAAGLAAAALGTDTGGSLRIPAAFCGIVGFRPSTGRYSSEGVVPLARSRDTIGPMARTVREVQLLDACITGEQAVPDLALSTLTLGVPDGFLTENLDPLVSAAFSRALTRLQNAGVRLRKMSLPGLWDLIDTASPVVTAHELLRDFAAFMLPRSNAANAGEFIAQIASPDVKELFAAVLSMDPEASARRYVQVQTDVLPAMQRLIFNAVNSQALDAWIFPTTPVPGFSVDANRELTLNGRSEPLFRTTVRNLQQASLIGLPSMSIPIRADEQARPCGLCIEALPGADRRLLAIGAAVQAALDQ